MEIGQTMKIAIPEDSFGYTVNDAANEGNATYYASLMTGLTRSLKLLAEMRNLHFVAKVIEGDLYIKRVDA